jgi:spore coat polysaccharide biosynthesis predicted glycosyltransferase SpsG
MNPSCVEIVVDGGPGYGFGHLSRSQTLARALEKAGAEVGFSPRSEIAAAALTTWRKANGEEPLLLVDLPYADDAAIAAAKRAGRKVVVLDHIGAAQADLAIRTDPRPVPMAAQQCAYGLQYAMIRPEILAQSPVQGDYAVVCIGGSDLGDLGVKAARRLSSAGRRTLLIRGPLAAPVSAAPEGVDLRVSPPDLPALLAGCAFAVTNAGTTALEAMALGKAVHVLAQTDAEQATAERFLSDGLILGVGLETLAVPVPDRAFQVAAAGRSAVDGRGAERVAALVLGLV